MTVTKEADSMNPENGSALPATLETSACDEQSDRGGHRELLETAGVALQLLTPRKLAREADNLARESLKIATGLSQIRFDSRDWRFKDELWQESAFYRRLGQLYLAWCDSVNALLKEGADNLPDLDVADRERARLLADILTSAMAPTNTLIGNPAALREFVDTRGRSLLKGVGTLARDMLKNGGMPKVVDDTPFTVGENLAATPGAVVHRNELLELIRYTPTTRQVYEIPTLVITPTINKYYFMDLAPGRSFVEYATAQGIQTYITSWRNPTAEHAHWDLDTYISALLEAVDAIREVTGSEQVNVLGLCAGGVQASLLLNTLAARGDQRVRAASFAVTLLDWDVAGPITAFRSSALLKLARSNSARRGVLPGSELAKLFVWLRPNDLVFNYWVNNYLMGKEPPSFDILAWNADTTNMPAALHSEFLDIYEHNLLCTPGALQVMGHPVNLKSITCDTFVTGAITDHITPWQGCYRSMHQLGGRCTFVLSNAGHIAALINPPGNPKASYFAGPEPVADPEEWLAAASQHTGSWWQAWAEWMSSRSGDKVAARKWPGNRQSAELAPAPGSYVLERIC